MSADNGTSFRAGSVAAAMLGKHETTLSRWAKAGRIDRVPHTLGREPYYYLGQILREKRALELKNRPIPPTNEFAGFLGQLS